MTFSPRPWATISAVTEAPLTSGAPVLALQDADCIFPVIEARLRYQFPARYDDLLTIQVWLTLVGRVRLNFGHRISNQDGKTILEAETFHACTSREEKPKRLPEALAEKLKPYLCTAATIDSNKQ